jgi:4-hydroxyphenylpyruvate dioxygenase
MLQARLRKLQKEVQNLILNQLVEKDEFGEVVRSGIYGAYGETVHLFVERKNYNGIFYLVIKNGNPITIQKPVGLNTLTTWLEILGWNRMNEAVKWFEDVMGFVNFLVF